MTTTLFAQKATVNETFRDIDEVSVYIGAGDLTITKSSSDAVEVMVDYNKSDTEIKIETKGNALTIKEKSIGYKSNGKPSWTLRLPDSKELSINVGAGDVNINGLVLNLEANIGAGDFYLGEINGKIHLNTGTGNIKIDNAEGSFNLNSGTGNLQLKAMSGSIVANSGTGMVNAEEMYITGESSMNSGTGRVTVSLGKSVEADLGVNSGTNDSSLKFNGHAFDGTLTMECDKKRGKIKAPFVFSDKEVTANGRSETLRKTKRFGNSGIEIQIGSGTGTAAVDQ
ncbi:MAG: hypothetical protein DHS20C18_46710 [Saprospiraceae bacterium]|nr:MAG: hypothetical protein DHS20C18_46710 [Saprospiraceae bacterium]